MECLTCASNADGLTPVSVAATASTHILDVSNGTTGTDYGPAQAPRDNNHIPLAMAASSSDGTPVVLYADPSTGALLIQKT